MSNPRDCRSARLLLAFCALLCTGQRAPADGELRPDTHEVALQFDFQVRGEAPAEITGRLSVEAQSSNSARVFVPVVRGTAGAVSVAAAFPVSLRVEIPGYWAFHEVINLREGETVRKHTVRLWPEATVEGTLRARKRPREMPRELEARMEPPAFRGPTGKVPWGAVKCPIEAGGRFSCRLPADTLDLSLRVPGFAPVYFWNYSLRQGTSKALGLIDIMPGASVSGWVLSESGAVQQADIALRRLVGPDGGSGEVRSQIARTRSETQASDAGFFQFRDVLPGSYSLEATSAGCAPATLQPLTVAEGEEVLLREALLLRAATELQVVVTPTLDWQDKPWKVELARVLAPGEGRSTAKPLTGAVDHDGLFRAPAQIPGLYSVIVLDSMGNSMFAEFDVPLGGEAPPTLEVRLSWVRVEGRVRYDEQPVAGSVWFGGKRGAVRVRMEADEEGEFTGVLPREGVWRAEIESVDYKGVLRNRVTVEAGPDRLARVEIEIPATKLAGTVRNEHGAPVEGAKVTLSADRERLEALSEGTGAFLFRGVPAGPAVLVAEKTIDGVRLTSDRVSIIVQDDEPATVELKLARTKELGGIILSAQGSVAGASVNLMAIRPKLGFGASATSREDGTFGAQVPGKAQSLLAIVSAPGFALQAAEVLADGTPVTLQVTREGGTLEASLPLGTQELAQANLDLVVLQGNYALPVGMLFNWARLHGLQFQQGERSFVVPALAAGAYRVCLAPASALVDWDFTGSTLPTTQCAAGYLQTGATLRLSVPGGS